MLSQKDVDAQIIPEVETSEGSDPPMYIYISSVDPHQKSTVVVLKCTAQARKCTVKQSPGQGSLMASSRGAKQGGKEDVKLNWIELIGLN